MNDNVVLAKVLEGNYKDELIEIRIAQKPEDCKISMGGTDVSKHFGKVIVEMCANSLTCVKLEGVKMI